VSGQTRTTLSRPFRALLLLLALVAAAPAHAASPAETAAKSLEGDPVYVHPGVAERLTVPEQGKVRLEIVRSAIGRIKVAVVPAGVAARAGGVGSFANEIDRTLHVRGALIVVAGSDYWVVTSYPQSDAAADALRAAVNKSPDDRLVDELLAAIPRLGRIDPGPESDPDGQEPPSVPDPDDFFDDVGDAFKLGVLIVAVAVALPFILGAVLLAARARRRRAREKEVRESGERSADDELLALGEDIESLDLDTSMPNAPRAALTEYEQAIAHYDQANELLEGDPTEYRVEQARAAIAAGRRHIAAARERLG
jgi:hypothetical protein